MENAVKADGVVSLVREVTTLQISCPFTKCSSFNAGGHNSSNLFFHRH